MENQHHATMKIDTMELSYMFWWQGFVLRTHDLPTQSDRTEHIH